MLRRGSFTNSLVVVANDACGFQCKQNQLAHCRNTYRERVPYLVLLHYTKEEADEAEEEEALCTNGNDNPL